MTAVLSQLPADAPWAMFFGFFGLTVVALVFGMVFGIQGKRPPHIISAGLAVVLLGVTIYYAELVGTYYEFPVWPLRIHLCFAYAATGSVLPVAWTGIVRLKKTKEWKLHLRVVCLFLLIVGGSVATGVWIFLVGTPKLA